MHDTFLVIIMMSSDFDILDRHALEAAAWTCLHPCTNLAYILSISSCSAERKGRCDRYDASISWDGCRCHLPVTTNEFTDDTNHLMMTCILSLRD
jgi:hypothetical protein